MDTVHPACIFLFFVGIIGFTLCCLHPVMVAVSCVCAGVYLCRLKGWRAAWKTLRFMIPLYLIIAIANPLFNHRGVTFLFMLFNQWITLEAVLYGVVAGGQLVAVILWFACYQVVMTSDKFLFLFGQIAPSIALLITMTLRLIPELQLRLDQIRQSQQMLRKKPERLLLKMNSAIRRLSTLLTWSMENAVETADSMKARGYGVKRRTTFHLFHFDSRDAVILGVLLLFGGICLLGRFFGHGVMEFYPRMDAVITGDSGLVVYGVFAVFALSPTIFELAESGRHTRYFAAARGTKTRQAV